MGRHRRSWSGEGVLKDVNMVLVYKILKKIKKKAACKTFVTPITYGLNKERSFEDLPRTTLFLKSLLKFSVMYIASIRRSQVQ